MKSLSSVKDRWLALAASMFLALLVPTAYAVVKNVTVVNSDGDALANTKVTIVFPDGSEVEEETDDDGMLIYDFPEDGDYVINYPDGSMTVAVSGGIPVWVWVAGGVAAAGITYAIVDDDDNPPPSDSGSGGGSSGGSGSIDIGCPEIASTCDVETFNPINPDDHASAFSGVWDIECDDNTDTITGLNKSNGNVTTEWSCELGSGSDVACVSTASCNYFGDITTCELLGGFDVTGWSGTMSAGIDGTLPDRNMNGIGEPIAEDFDCSF